MKNIHLQKTDKPSSYVINYMEQNMQWQNIYITNSKEIKEGDWYYLPKENKVAKCPKTIKLSGVTPEWTQKIILTTDQDLIKDGVQAIEDSFLEWFVNNPSCEKVEIESIFGGNSFNHTGKTPSKKERLHGCYDNGEQIIGKWEELFIYKIIIPKEPKQETLEEAAEEYNSIKIAREAFIKGGLWQQEQDKKMYSEDDMKQAFENGSSVTSWSDMGIEMKYDDFETWFKTYKKK